MQNYNDEGQLIEGEISCGVKHCVKKAYEKDFLIHEIYSIYRMHPSPEKIKPMLILAW